MGAKYNSFAIFPATTEGGSSTRLIRALGLLWAEFGSPVDALVVTSDGGAEQLDVSQAYMVLNKSPLQHATYFFYGEDRKFISSLAIDSHASYIGAHVENSSFGSRDEVREYVSRVWYTIRDAGPNALICGEEVEVDGDIVHDVFSGAGRDELKKALVDLVILRSVRDGHNYGEAINVDSALLFDLSIL